MNSGKFDELIEIQYQHTTQDSTYGTEVINWLPLVVEPGSPTVAAPVFADWQDVMPSRSEAVKQGLDVARNQSRVRIPYRGDVDSSMRIVRKGTPDVVYSIVGGPAIIGRREQLEMVVERYSS
jgi:head-tail adaptor